MSFQRILQTRYPCDLHCHTVRSDGYDTPQELIDRAARLGMAAIAITDHDINPPDLIDTGDGKMVDPVEYARTQGLILVPGYEFSTDTWVDEVHICGYVLDWKHADLQAEIKAAARSKTDAYFDLCTRLTEMGKAIDWEADVLHYTTADGHKASRQPDEVQRKHIFEAMAQKGYTESWSAAKLMVRDNPDLNVHRRKIDPLDAINLIHRCGGFAVLAHPYLIDASVTVPGYPEMSRFDYIERLIAGGLDGIEVCYSYDKTTYQGQLTPEAIEAECRARYTNRLRILSGGSDYHAGQKKGEKKLRSLGERGLTIEEFESYYANEIPGLLRVDAKRGKEQ
jgi:3',5'-nucleoside bisphosphate phosphatase